MPLTALADVQISTDNATWVDATYYGLEIYLENGTMLIDGLDDETTYYFRAKNSSTNWTYLSIRTAEGGIDKMIVGAMILLLAMMGFFAYIGYIFYKEENFMFYLCFLFWYLALLMPLFGIRILANAEGISTTLQDLMNTLYRVYLNVYYVLIILLIVYFLVLVLSWAYRWKEPSWKKRQLGSDKEW